MAEALSYPVWSEVDLNAIAYNINQIWSLIGKKRKIAAVVKADAYGHGVLEVAKVAQKLKVPVLAIARVYEGIELREAGFTCPILMLNALRPDEIEPVVKYNITPNVCCLEVAKKLSSFLEKHSSSGIYSLPFKIHIEIDTGIGRVGMHFKEAVDLIKKIAALPCLEIEGIYTHFSIAAEDPEFTSMQLSRFSNVVEELKKANIFIPIRHTANSAGVMKYPESYFEMVRPGIMIYGLYPHPALQSLVSLKPAMSLKSRIIFIKEAQVNRTIGYSHTYHTINAKTTIATISVGYRDGYSRLISNRGEVLVKGKRVPIVGRISMDQLTIDISKIKDQVKLGDEVVLFGEQNGAYLSVDEVASWANTINYEVICAVGANTHRIYIGKD